MNDTKIASKAKAQLSRCPMQTLPMRGPPEIKDGEFSTRRDYLYLYSTRQISS